MALRLFLAYLDDGPEGNANQVRAQIGDCACSRYGVAMGSVGTAVSLFHTVEAERGEDPRPSLELHLAAALDQIAADGACE
ncbi:hypothetical protein [Mycobacterium sp. ITM-2016-00318]|uniref:hypothetical protein n=1 Tax=Mycobacterium sp. ITM-2016-00318 TaxID=2099693 RepID=UPI000CFA0FD4|nr:hypothetical protein [Mycobacterium sp. ITM-2016-00318]WNG94996.1 hypothetical protein C6A82_011490 [Mycobacterium sp. ITM-2016-00318]